jgi:hypothetical protein
MARVLVTGHTKVAQGVRLGIEDAAVPKDQAFSIFKGWAASAPGAPGGGEEEFVVQSSIPVATASLTFGTNVQTSEDVIVLDFIAPDAFDARTGNFDSGYRAGFPYSYPNYRISEVENIASPLLRSPAEPLIVLAWQDSAAAGGGGFTGTVTNLRVQLTERYLG